MALTSDHSRADLDDHAFPTVPASAGARLPAALRWLAVPVVLALLILVGMATTATQQDSSNRGEETAGARAADRSEDQPVARPDAADTNIEPVTVTARTDRGDVDITFGVDGVARLSPTGGGGGDAGVGPTVDLVPGTEAGFTLSEDGRLEPVAPGQLGDDDFGFRTDREGVIVDVPGDTPILLRPDGVQGGVSASDVGLDYATIPPDENGEVVLADGTTLTPIENPAPARVVVIDSDDLPWTWVFGTIATVAVISALAGYLLHRRRPEPLVTDAGFMVTAGFDTMSESGFQQFLHELAADPDLARAVRLGFHAAEQGLGVLPPRKRSETPNEWAARVVGIRPELSPALTSLCDVFARARFGPEPVSHHDRVAVIEQLATLRSSGSHRSSGEPRSEPAATVGAAGTGR
jgi:hypothetical protein